MGFVFTEQTSTPSIWQVVSSSDGLNLAGISTDDGYVYTSDDGGLNWTQQSLLLSTDESRNSIACDGTGQYIVVSTYDGLGTGTLYRSDDYGVTWGALSSAGSKNWTCIASSSTGAKLVAVDFGTGSGGSIWTSTDSGANWTERTGAGSLEWQSVSCSGDGSVILAGSSAGIWLSDDSGATWSDVTQVAGVCTKVNSDGTVLLQWDVDDGIFISINSGVDWTDISTGVSQRSQGISINSDASMIVVPGFGDLYYSTNYGSTWNTEVGINTSWMTCSSDASVGYVSGYYTYGWTFVYSSFSITSITPNIGATAGGTPVTIIGEGFDPAATAAIDGNDLTDVTVVDSTTITGVTPAGTAGVVDVIVTNP